MLFVFFVAILSLRFSALGLISSSMNQDEKSSVPEESVERPTLAHVAPVTTTDLTPNWRLSPVADRQSYVLAQPQATSEFDSYFLEHGLANGATGAIGVVPYVPMVAVPATGARESSGQVQAAR